MRHLFGRAKGLCVRLSLARFLQPLDVKTKEVLLAALHELHRAEIKTRGGAVRHHKTFLLIGKEWDRLMQAQRTREQQAKEQAANKRKSRHRSVAVTVKADHRTQTQTLSKVFQAQGILHDIDSAGWSWLHAGELFPDLCIRAPSLEIGQSLWFALVLTVARRGTVSSSLHPRPKFGDCSIVMVRSRDDVGEWGRDSGCDE